MKRRTLVALLAASMIMVLTVVAPASAEKGDNLGQGAEHSREVNLQILAINDFHGNIATSSGSTRSYPEPLLRVRAGQAGSISLSTPLILYFT